MSDDRIPPPGPFRDLAAEIAADERAARARDYGEADAATYPDRVREGAASVQGLEPEPPPASATELGRILGRVERSWSRRDAPDPGRKTGPDLEPDR